MAYTAKFKTAYLQRMEILEATLAAAVNVGDLVTFTPATGALAASVDGDASTANSYVIAQSDISFAAMGGGRSGPYDHVKVEDKNLQYDAKVAASATKKKVAVFKVINPSDVVVKSYTTREQLA